MEKDKVEQIIQGFTYVKTVLNSVVVSGVDNFQKLSAVYNNVDVFLNMIANGEITIIDNSSSNENN